MHPSRRIHAVKSEKLKGKQVVLAITGSIAAGETVKLARELIRHGAEVVPVLAKLADTEEIVERVIRRIGTRELEGKRVVVVTGSTVEPIDDVRVVTNRTSGETGVELAKAAFEKGADVELWLGRHHTVAPHYIP